ncbi:hypothetical protein LJR039_007325 [Pseudorhodoferax sp. LjRoot39]|uniref:hypothetical protein n=1 Tax=Pseudorhodoferax sp. LjRoot39 TaxID=3342328 RepID=UPI003ECF0623
MKTLITAAVAALALTGVAHAADDHKGHAHDAKGAEAHPHEAKALHGGVVAVVKDVNYELVAKDGEAALYVSDHGKPVDLAGATAKLTMLSGTKKQEVALAPGDNALRAKGAFTVPAGTKAVVVVHLKAKPALTARFTLP